MDFSSKKQALLYLDRNGFYFYESGRTDILNLPFLPTSIKDLDIVDQKSLENQIQSFSLKAKLAPSNVYIIISPNLIFEKDIAVTDLQKQKEEIDRFINTVPFDSVSSKTLPIQTGVKVLGVNEDLYLSIKIAFEKLGSTVILVLPYHLLGADSALLNNFTVQNIATLLKKLDKFKEQNLLSNKVKSEESHPSSEKDTHAKIASKKNTRIYIMVGFFIILLIILGYMLMTFK